MNSFNNLKSDTIPSWTVWDFFNQNVQMSFKNNIYAIHCSDAYIEKMIINSLSITNYTNKKIYSLIGTELTEDIIDEKFFTLDLFTENLSYYILLADEIKISTIEYFLSRINDIDNQNVFFFFRKKSPSWKLISNCKTSSSMEIKDIKFWEGEKLLSFLETYLRISLPYNLTLFLVETLNLEVGEYIKYLKLIKTNFINVEQMTIQNVKKLILNERVDNFHYATMLGKSDFKNFYKELSEKDISFDNLTALFCFLQSHLIKLMDPSYCKKKKRLSRYDNEIATLAKTWDKINLSEWLLAMQEYELRSKTKDLSLLILFKQKYLSYL